MVKVGDRVRVVGYEGLHKMYDEEGVEGIITEVITRDNYAKMQTDNGFIRMGLISDFEVITQSPPQKITQNGYEYSLVGPVKPDWLVDGAWVVSRITGKLYKVFEGCNDRFYAVNHSAFNNSGNTGNLTAEEFSAAYRPHEPKDWKWGDWAMYYGERVFVMSSLTHDGLVGISFPNIDGADLTDPSEQWDFADEYELTPTF